MWTLCSFSCIPSQIDPPDASENLEVLSFKTKFVQADQFQNRTSRGDCPQNWAQSDDEIKEWIKQPAVLDAFTMLVLGAYSSSRARVPPCVANDTKMFRGVEAEPLIDRISEIVSYTGDASDGVWTSQIKKALEQHGTYGEWHIFISFWGQRSESQQLHSCFIMQDYFLPCIKLHPAEKHPVEKQHEETFRLSITDLSSFCLPAALSSNDVNQQVIKLFQGKTPSPEYKKFSATGEKSNKREYGFNRIILKQLVGI